MVHGERGDFDGWYFTGETWRDRPSVKDALMKRVHAAIREVSSLQASACQHVYGEFNINLEAYICKKCGHQEPILPQPQPRTYSQSEVEDLVKRVTLRSYEAGKRARLEEQPKPQPKEPLPVHRAIANSHRIGPVYAHRPYWIDPNEA